MARETALPDLDDILAIPPGERPGIEVFVHGALCYSFSGQCLLSSCIGGRSGNRGMCAQPCRKPYQLVAGDLDAFGRPVNQRAMPYPDTFLLSTRDLCLYPDLAAIAGREITAMKIEGRMRSPGYVATVVSCYRQALDALAAGRAPDTAGAVTLAAAFNRGFTRGYLMGERGAAMMGRDRPDNRGLLLGKVIGPTPRKRGFMVRPAGSWVPGPGDGLVLVDPGTGVREGLVLKKGAQMRGSRLFIPGEPPGCREGQVVWLTASRELERIAESRTRRREPGRRRIPLDMEAAFPAWAPPVLSGRFTVPGRGEIRVRLEADFALEEAGAHPLSADAIRHQLARTGESPFRVRSLDLRYGGGLFAPLGELNRFRREFLDRVKEALLAAMRPGAADVEEASSRIDSFLEDFRRRKATGSAVPLGPRLAVYASDLSGTGAACSAGADAICLEPPGGAWRDRVALIRDAARVCSDHGAVMAWKWPRVTGRRFLDKALPALLDLEAMGVEEVMVEQAGLAEAVLARAPGIRVTGGPGLNIFNAHAAAAFYPFVKQFCISMELTGAEMGELIADSGGLAPEARYEVLCQGSLEVMVSEDRLPDLAPPCPFLGLRDETGRVFPVYADSEGRTRVLNAVELCLVDRVDARRRGPAYAGKMTACYRDALELAQDGVVDAARWAALRDRSRSMSLGGITTGHFLRGCAPWE
jgi:putative protease